MENQGSRRMYCIEHGYMDEAFLDSEGNEFHYHSIRHANGNAGVDVCYGTFTTCPPPEMTEEEWDSIMEQEKFIEEVLVW